MRIVDRRPWPVRTLDALDHRPEAPIARALVPLGGLYAMGARLLRVLREDRPLPAAPPSIGVGNLRVGGTGKTPLVADLGARLAERGLRVAVVTRGYRGAGGGDEPGWLQGLGLQVIVDSDRARGHAVASTKGAEVVLLDDALQCRDRPGLTLALILDRDLERMPRPLPAGPAREGSAALRRADRWVVRREADSGELRASAATTSMGAQAPVGFRLVPTAAVAPTGERRPPSELGDLGPIVAVSGLARPASFESDLATVTADLRGSWRESDHWTPGAGDLESLRAWAEAIGARAIVCPEKNRERLPDRLGPLEIWSLASSLRWDVDDPLEALGIVDHLGLRP